MPIGIVQAVDPVTGTIEVAVQSGPGSRTIRRVRLLKGNDIPEYNTRVLVLQDGRNHYCVGAPEEATPEAEEARAALQACPGDKLIGDTEGTHLQVRSGGLISAMADKVTGFIANKSTGIIQVLGKILSFDTTYFHRLVKTKGQNTVIDERLVGSPFGIPLSLEMIKNVVKTETGEWSINVSAFSGVSLNFLINPASGNAMGANISLNIQTPIGLLRIAADGVTGNTEVFAPGLVKITSAQTVMINSEGLPGDRVRTASDFCWATGGMCGGGSPKLFVGKGL